MGSVRDDIVGKLWRGRDAFLTIPQNLYLPDNQGWGSDHAYLVEGINSIRPAVVVEVGVWKGGSTITMATALKKLELDATVISVDTWLGAWDHWADDRWHQDLGFVNGYPMIFYKFCTNVILAGVQDYVVPFPLDSVNAANVLRHFSVKLDMLHIDGGHDYHAVTADLREWWPMLKYGGLLIGDDYRKGNDWPEVVAAFDDFFGPRGLLPLENVNDKCRVRKPADHAVS